VLIDVVDPNQILTWMGSSVDVSPRRSRAFLWASPLAVTALLLPVLLASDPTRASCRWPGWWHRATAKPPATGGEWYWLRSPEQEKRVIIGHYNRYCVRCHGVDGRGVWDIPDVPDFSNDRWQQTRSDGQLVRAILEGRGAVMPPFRGTLTLEEAWGVAHYLRTFVPGTEQPRPDRVEPAKPAEAPAKPAKPVEAPPPAVK
jgi:cbb3-type cytochrome c oxidase subunit III